jgi:hypothetical protein
MINEIFHYLFLPSRTRKRLRECVKTISTSSESVPGSIKEIENFIKNREIGQAIYALDEKGNELNISKQKYWLNLYLVAREHKMRDVVISLEGKAKNGTGS